ncbi:MAG: class I SAM-dependent methyltransferase [Patescibacteria group bacterium]|jgi:ubiquinone/menaquinone biosynthesis C-methylase UbiE
MIDKNLYAKSGFYNIAMKLLGWDRGISGYIKNLSLPCPNNGKILEVGCGSGIIGLQLLKMFPEASLLATDYEKNFLEETLRNANSKKINISRITVGVSDISNPKEVKKLNNTPIIFEPNSFDIVCAGGVLGYSKNQEKTLRDLVSLLKPNGYFIDIETNDNFGGKWVTRKYDYKRLSLDNYKKILEKENCVVEIKPFSLKNFPANFTRTGIIAKNLTINNI